MTNNKKGKSYAEFAFWADSNLEGRKIKSEMDERKQGKGEKHIRNWFLQMDTVESIVLLFNEQKAKWIKKSV